MSFGTFFLYFVGAIILLRVIAVVLLYILASILVPDRPAKTGMPSYRYAPTKPKTFPDHKSGELAKKLGDLSNKQDPAP